VGKRARSGFHRAGGRACGPCGATTARRDIVSILTDATMANALRAPSPAASPILDASTLASSHATTSTTPLNPPSRSTRFPGCLSRSRRVIHGRNGSFPPQQLRSDAHRAAFMSPASVWGSISSGRGHARRARSLVGLPAVRPSRAGTTRARRNVIRSRSLLVSLVHGAARRQEPQHAHTRARRPATTARASRALLSSRGNATVGERGLS